MSRHLKKGKEYKMHDQVLNQVIISLARNPDMTINMETSVLIYTVHDLLENGVEVSRAEKRILANTWPADLLAEIKTLHDRLVGDAQDSGMLEEGDDHEDLPTVPVEKVET